MYKSNNFLLKKDEFQDERERERESLFNGMFERGLNMKPFYVFQILST